MNSLKFFSMTLAFFLELMILAAYACVGSVIQGSASMRYGVAAVTAVAVVAGWALFAAPKAQRRLRKPALFYFKGLICGGAAAILFMAHRPQPAVAFICVAAGSLVLEASLSEA